MTAVSLGGHNRLAKGTVFLAFALGFSTAPISQAQTWQGFARNAQHSAESTVRSQKLFRISWKTPVDLQPQYEDNELFIHYGSPVITGANTVIVPVKTGVTDGFQLQARSGADGKLLWTQTTDYTLPPHGWTPSYSPTLTPQGRIYWAAAGGTLNYRSNLDAVGSVLPTQVNFYVSRTARFSKDVQISTPLTSDANGTIYFGFETSGSTAPKALQGGGIARVDMNGKGSFAILQAAGSGQTLRVVQNCAPALSTDGRTVYIAAHGTASIRNGRAGYLFALDSVTLQVKNLVALLDPESGEPASLPDEGSASPTVGPDGKVFFGVLDNPFVTSKGWLLQFNADLSQTSNMKPGAFGWDDTASIVPATMIPSYSGTSTYLLMTKYNNYAGTGGDGLNRLAILDPNASQVDPRTGVTVMKEVITILGRTPDNQFADHPGAVREWCINSAVVDPASRSVLANSEDGKLYRWDLHTNTFSEVITLTSGLGEAYTPTIIGSDGKVYAINNATLFAVGGK